MNVFGEHVRLFRSSGEELAFWILFRTKHSNISFWLVILLDSPFTQHIPTCIPHAYSTYIHTPLGSVTMVPPGGWSLVEFG
jgi:hypothetical protein